MVCMYDTSYPSIYSVCCNLSIVHKCVCYVCTYITYVLCMNAYTKYMYMFYNNKRNFILCCYYMTQFH